MSFFSEVLIEQSFAPYSELHAAYGFVPSLFRVQSGFPRLLAAQISFLRDLIFADSGLSRTQKESILLAVAGAHPNSYCAAMHSHILQGLGMDEQQILSVANGTGEGAGDEDTILRDFCLKLVACPPSISGKRFPELRQVGFDDERILEGIVTAAMGRFLCTLADGLRPSVDPELGMSPRCASVRQTETMESVDVSGPFLNSVPCKVREFAPFAFLQEQFGFVPNFFRAQMLRPDLVKAEINAIGSILLPDDALSRVQKERILLVASAANSNTYFVTVHSEILSLLGVSVEDSDEIVSDHRATSIPDSEKLLLDSAAKLAVQPSEFGVADVSALRAHGFGDPQILEAIVMSAFSNFLNTVQIGLGSVPDFTPRRVLAANKLYPLAGEGRPKTYAAGASVPPDADSELVARTRGGDTGAFEELVRRHTRRMFGMLVAMLGNVDDAGDAVQDVFMKAFEHLGSFQGRSKFSTWLTSIAINSGTGRLRTRRPTESLDIEADDETFRPLHIQSWADNPEQLLSTSQMRDLVRQAVQRLPEKYRAAILLRDIGQLSTEDAASELGLGVPALKARLLRGRLMLREALAPHFARDQVRSSRAEL